MKILRLFWHQLQCNDILISAEKQLSNFISSSKKEQLRTKNHQHQYIYWHSKKLTFKQLSLVQVSSVLACLKIHCLCSKGSSYQMCLFLLCTPSKEQTRKQFVSCLSLFSIFFGFSTESMNFQEQCLLYLQQQSV